MKNYILKTGCFIVILFFIAGNCYGSDVIKQWSKIWGSADHDSCSAVSVDSNGNIYVAGGTEGGFDGQTNAGNYDIFLTKYNSTGTKQWSKIWGSSSYDSGHGVSVDSEGNIYIAGFTYGGFDGQTNAGGNDIFLTKYNSAGTRQWSKIWGSVGDDTGQKVSVDSNGNIYVAGFTYGGFDGQTNAGFCDIFLTKYNSAGAKQWSKIWGSAANDFGNDVSVDSNGNVYVAGFTYGEFDGQTNAGDTEIFLTKYNSLGAKEWSKIWGSVSSDVGNGVSVDLDGNVYVTGYTYGGFDGQTNAGSGDIFLTKYNSFGTNQWSKIWGSVNYDSGYGVSVDLDGNVYVAGLTSGEFDGQTNAGNLDIFLTKYNSSGARQWSKIWGSDDYDYGHEDSVDLEGNIYVAGYTSGEFDGQTNAGFSDIFLTKFVIPVPFVDITNLNFSVELPATTATIAGTNNEFIAIGNTMWWENSSTSGVSGSLFADSSKAWTISGIELTPVANIITVSGSNIFGDVATDTITIDLVPEPGILWIIGLMISWLVSLSFYSPLKKGVRGLFFL